MSPSVKAIPDNYPRVTPYLIVDGAAQAIDFYTQGSVRPSAGAWAGPTARSVTPSLPSATP